MPKYYIKCGSLEIIRSTNKNPLEAAIDSVWELNDIDTLDEYFYIDERGMKNHKTAKNNTVVISTTKVLKKAGWTIEE